MTITVRIAKSVDMRPKDKARVSPVVTKRLKLGLNFQSWRSDLRIVFEDECP